MTSRPGLTPSQRGILIALASAVALAGLVLVALLAFRSTSDPDGALPATTTTLVATSSAPPAPTTTAPPVSTTIATTTTTTVPDTTTTEPAETTTTTTVRDEFVLRPEGIDRLFFGADPETVIDEVTDRLGEPTDDTDWLDQMEEFDGLCGGTEARFVTWDNLRLFFTDRESDWVPGATRHFEAYIVTEGDDDLVFETDEGVGVGSSRAEIEAAFGDRVSFLDHPIYGEIFEVDPRGAGYLYGSLTGLGDDDVAIEIVGGTLCGE